MDGMHVVLGGLVMHVAHWEMLGPEWWEGSYCPLPKPDAGNDLLERVGVLVRHALDKKNGRL